MRGRILRWKFSKIVIGTWVWGLNGMGGRESSEGGVGKGGVFKGWEELERYES